MCAKSDNDLYAFWDSVLGDAVFIMVLRTLIRVDVGFWYLIKCVSADVFVLFDVCAQTIDVPNGFGDDVFGGTSVKMSSRTSFVAICMLHTSWHAACAVVCVCSC